MIYLFVWNEIQSNASL